MEKKFTYTTEIHSGNYYGKNHISLQEVMRLFLEASRLEFKKSLEIEGKSWFIYSWNIEVIDYPVIDQKVHAETNIIDIDRISVYRNFILKDEDRKPLARGIAQMVLIDNTTRRLSFIPMGQNLKAINRNLNKKYNLNLSVVSKLAFEHKIKMKILMRDIDKNQHLNNISYIDMVLEGVFEYYPSLINKKIKGLKLNYKKEIVYPSELFVDLKKDSNLICFRFSDLDEKVLAIGIVKF